MSFSVLKTAVAFSILLGMPSAMAGVSAPPPTVAAPEKGLYDAGRVELQSGLGAYWSFSPDGSERPTLNYSLSTYRLGVMLNTPSGTGLLSGNAELLVEAFYGSVLDGPGDWLAGGNLLLRYNFVQPDANWVPYVQLGGGGLGNDIHKDQSQRLIGQSFEFSLLAAVGLRYQWNEKWGVSLEGGYRHISNADRAERNRGLDSLGVLAGLTYSF